MDRRGLEAEVEAEQNAKLVARLAVAEKRLLVEEVLRRRAVDGRW